MQTQERDEVVLRENFDVGGHPDWMPDPGVYNFVRDHLRDHVGCVDVDAWPETWIPMGIIGTMEWALISGWWLFINTGVYKSSLAYEYIFEIDGYEINPDWLLLFMEEARENTFEERWTNLGLDQRERAEISSFLKHDIYTPWGVEAPPQEVMERIAYCTILWVLSPYGRDWLADMHQIFADVYEWGRAFYNRETEEMLAANLVTCTNRELSTCHRCNEKVWCVRPYVFRHSDYLYTCNHCAYESFLDETERAGMKRRDKYLQSPSCGHFGGDCLNTACGHCVLDQETIDEALLEKSYARVGQWREEGKLFGARARMAAGQTPQDLVDHFQKPSRATPKIEGGLTDNPVPCPECEVELGLESELRVLLDENDGEITFPCPGCQLELTIVRK